jgi:hypothetical protein
MIAAYWAEAFGEPDGIQNRGQLPLEREIAESRHSLRHPGMGHVVREVVEDTGIVLG